MKIRFFSDSNLDGFLQSIAHTVDESQIEVDAVARLCQIPSGAAVEDLVSDWGGVIENA